MVKIESVKRRIKKSFKKRKPNRIYFNRENEGLAETLVVSYCFPPDADTSGNNMAKRIREIGEVVDVIQNNLGGMREEDPHLLEIAGEFTEHRMVIYAEPSFGNWEHIHDFCTRGMEELERMTQKKGVYRKIYSRAMFPASNFLAWQYKMEHPQTRWVAELSDPILYDIRSRVREVNITDESYLEKVNQAIKKIGAPEYQGGNLFYLCEYLAYLFADEIIFTNQNQQEYMMNNFPVKNISEIVLEKSVIKRHPTLPDSFYHRFKSNYPLDEGMVNLAYFGSFYETRDLDDVYQALEHLKPEYQDKYCLHIFTSDVKGLNEVISRLPIRDNIRVNGYLNYLEFLNLTTRVDCLIVVDARTRDCKEINPYLPSKYSDYIGSGTSIWSICEKGSVLSTYDVRYQSFLDDKPSSQKTLEQIIKDYVK